MDRWGLQGMQSFEQVNVAKKEGSKLESAVNPDSLELSSQP